MAWDFSTDPELQWQLDRIAEKEQRRDEVHRVSVVRRILRGHAAAPGGVPTELVLEAVTSDD